MRIRFSVHTVEARTRGGAVGLRIASTMPLGLFVLSESVRAQRSAARSCMRIESAAHSQCAASQQPVQIATTANPHSALATQFSDVFDQIVHKFAGSGENAPRPRRPYGRRTRAGSIRSVVRQSYFAKVTMGRWVCPECPCPAIGG
jgi:hypothetical protein